MEEKKRNIETKDNNKNEELSKKTFIEKIVNNSNAKFDEKPELL